MSYFLYKSKISVIKHKDKNTSSVNLHENEQQDDTMIIQRSSEKQMYFSNVFININTSYKYIEQKYQVSEVDI